MALTVRGRVVDGHLRVDTPVDLPDNTEVELTVVADDSDAEDPELLAALDRADAAIARGEQGRPLEEVLEQLRARSLDEALSDTPAGRG
jgi:hypothetical protein